VSEKTRGRALALLLLLAAIAPLAALDKPAAFRPDLGVVYVPNLDPDKETASLVTYVLGCGVVYPLNVGLLARGKASWSFEPSVDFYTAYYELDASGRAVPTELADRQAFVLGLLVDAPIVLSVPLDEKFTFGAGAGLAFDLRAAFQDSDPSIAEGTGGEINAYFWGKGRFVLPSTFIRIEYRLTERVDFGFSVRAYWPLFNFWAGEGLPILDQGIFGGSLGVRYKL